jgi:hypothetical protein
MNEQQLQEIAATFPYPATPDMAAAVRYKLAARTKGPLRPVSRRLAWVVVLLLLAVAGTLAVPQVRAAVWRILQAGAITIFVPEATATTVPTATAVPSTSRFTPPDATPRPALVQDILLSPAGEMTLAEVQAKTNFSLYLPAGWPLPDRVYYQTHDWPVVVIFVWLEPGTADEVRLALYQIHGSTFAYKEAVQV